MKTVSKVAAGVLLGGGMLIGGVVGAIALTDESEDASDRAKTERWLDLQEAQRADPPIEALPEDPLEEKVAKARVGEPVRSGGIELTVTGARAESSLSYTDVLGDRKTEKAKQGGRYVFVETKIKNSTSRGIDLTCSFEVDGKVVDDSGREFDTVEELSGIRGNPECNDMLEPGSKDTMIWVYRVPDGAEVSSFRFSDVSDLETEHAPAEVELPSV